MVASVASTGLPASLGARYAFRMSGEAQLMLMIAGVHLLGLACVAVLMIPALREGPDVPPRPSDGGSDDGWGNYPRRPTSPHDVPGGGIPLPDAAPARVRLRDHGRLRERLPTRQRRPAREPVRRPVRTGAPPQRRARTSPGSRRRS
jgi:hypothetical protein